MILSLISIQWGWGGQGSDRNFHLFFIFSTLMASLLVFSDPSMISAGLLISGGKVQVSKEEIQRQEIFFYFHISGGNNPEVRSVNFRTSP